MPTTQPPDDDRLKRMFDAPGIARGFLADRPIRRGRLEGHDGIFLTVRLTSYRSLPLSCIEGVLLSIDATAIDPATIRLVVSDIPYALSDLAALPDRWWFILDLATLFVPLPTLAAGTHTIDATLITVEPYMTAGRFSMFNADRRSLTLEDTR